MNVQQSLYKVARGLTLFTPVAILLGNACSEITLALVAILFLVHCIQTKNFSWAKRPWFMVALILWCYTTLRGLMPDTSWDSAWHSFAWIRFIVFAAALAEWILPDEKTRRWLFLTLMGTLSFLAADAILQYVVGYDIIGRPILEDRLTAVFTSPIVGIELSWLFLPVTMGLIQNKQPLNASLFTVLILTAILLSGERLAFLQALVMLLIILVYFGRKQRAVYALIPLAGLGIAGMLLFNPTMLERQINTTIATLSNYSQSHYGMIWNSGIAVTRDHPIFGVGIRHYTTTCMDEKYGPAVIEPSQLSRCGRHPHNIYLEWLSQTGVIGGMGLVCFIVLLLRELLRIHGSGKGDTLLFGLLLILCARFFPFIPSTSFFIAWYALPLWLYIGWALSYTHHPHKSA